MPVIRVPLIKDTFAGDGPLLGRVPDTLGDKAWATDDNRWYENSLDSATTSGGLLGDSYNTWWAGALLDTQAGLPADGYMELRLKNAGEDGGEPQSNTILFGMRGADYPIYGVPIAITVSNGGSFGPEIFIWGYDIADATGEADIHIGQGRSSWYSPDPWFASDDIQMDLSEIIHDFTVRLECVGGSVKAFINEMLVMDLTLTPGSSVFTPGYAYIDDFAVAGPLYPIDSVEVGVFVDGPDPVSKKRTFVSVNYFSK